MSDSPKRRNFDLEERTLRFAKDVQHFLKLLPRGEANDIYRKQLLRSSSSVGANYIEANDALGRRDFLVKIRTSRREARETAFWLRLIESADATLTTEQARLLDEAWQFVKIFSAIAVNTQKINT